jgi:hypothetical protein
MQRYDLKLSIGLLTRDTSAAYLPRQLLQHDRVGRCLVGHYLDAVTLSQPDHSPNR